MSTPTEPVIRPVALADAAMLQTNCFTQNTVAEMRQVIRKNLRGYAEGNTLPLVAEVGGVVVGSATLQRHTHSLRTHRATIVGLVVCARYQRQGIARRLVQAFQEHVASLGIQILEISVRGGTPAEEVYRRLGFVECGRVVGGLLNPGGDPPLYDEVYLWMSVKALQQHEARPSG